MKLLKYHATTKNIKKAQEVRGQICFSVVITKETCMEAKCRVNMPLKALNRKIHTISRHIKLLKRPLARYCDSYRFSSNNVSFSNVNVIYSFHKKFIE